MLSLLHRASRTPWVVTTAVLAMLAASFIVTISPAAAVGPAITVTKQAPSSVLLGDDATIRLTAANPSTNVDAVTEFNLTFRDVLPLNVTYKAGSTVPTNAGEPTVITAPVTGQQTLIWPNVSDLQVDSTFDLRFQVTPDPVLLPVGSSVSNTGDAFASTDPRQVPKFTAAGAPIPSGSVQSASSGAAVTSITAITVVKAEPSPEHELLRGIHAQPTVYTLTVANNDVNPTNTTTLTDYLPAGLEFLGCGGVDNSSAPEYPGAPSLTGTPVIAPADCPLPATVQTVSNPSADGATTYPAGVYTKITWNLGNFAAGQVRTIKYAAGIPLRSNVTTFAGGTPTAVSLLQTANLNNNTGASTRETATEIALTNTARISGTYTGPVASGGSTSVADDDRLTVTSEDISLQKSGSPGTFTVDGIATFTLVVRVSEYVSGSGISVVDTLPDGFCPLSSTTNFSTGAVSQCDATPGTDPTGATYSSVQQQGNGTFLITFSDLAVATNGVATITVQARMLNTYLSNGLPTVAGDSFLNRVDLTGTTTPIPGTDESGTQAVNDTSSSGLSTTRLTINKLIQPRQVPYTCDLGPYVESDDPAYTANDFLFRKGGRICFELNVTFPSGTDSRNVVITDVIPDGTAYEAGSATQIVNPVTPAYGLAFNEADAASGVDNPTWTLGDTSGAGGLYVPAGATFRVRFSVLVQRASDTTGIDINGNLMKMRSQSTAGAAESYRDQLDFSIAPAPPVAIVKGVAQVEVPSGPVVIYDDPATAPNNIDGSTAREGDVVTFRVDVSNNGSAANGNDFAIRGVDVWDVLAPGITCAQISNISAVSIDPGAPTGACTNPGDANQPSFAGNGTLSAIRWIFRTGVAGDPDRIQPGSSRTLTYDMLVPTPTRAGSVLTDTSYVRSFDGLTDVFDVVSTNYPAQNVDTTVLPADWDALPATDPSNVVIPDVALSKAITGTGITDTGNSQLTQAVNGETVTYRIGLNVPGRTTIFNAQVIDPLPASLSFVSASAGFSSTGASPAVGALPGTVTLNAADGTLTFPATYTNADDATHRFEVIVVGRVTPSSTTGAKPNTATYSSRASVGGTALTAKTAIASITVVVPSPTLTKSNGSGGTVSGGQNVTYTLRAANAAGRPAMHDTIVVDCVPSGLVFQSYGVPTQGSTSAAIPGDGSNGCPLLTTKLTWNVGSVAGGALPTLTYVVQVTTGASGQVAYTNSASLVGSSLPNGVNDGTVERVVSDAKVNTVTVNGATITKTVAPSFATIGQVVTFTARATLPSNINFYNASIIDQLPAGFDRTTVTTDSVTCVNADTTACSLTATELTKIPQGGGSTTIGWLMGDALANSQVRTVTVVYSVAVLDLAGVNRNATLVNSARVKWDTSATPPPTSAGATFGQQSAVPASATVTVQEPLLSIGKSVTDTTPAPGQPFSYTLTVTNSGAANVSTAYDVVVTDVIPTGVIVQTPLPAGAAIAGAGANGGGTITWTVPASIAAGASRTLTYNALLAPSATLATSALTNTADIGSYRSQPAAGRTYDGPSTTAQVTPAFPAFTVVKTMPSGSLAYIGDAFTWQIAVTNSGNADAFDVDVSDVLPPNWSFVAGSATVSISGGPTQTVVPTGSAIVGAVQTLTFTDLGDLAVGESLVIRLNTVPSTAVVIDPTVGSTIAHTNSAVATGDDVTGSDRNSSGPYTGSGSAAAHIDKADVAIVKSHTGAVVAGSTFTWNLTVSNAGTDVAVGPFIVSDEVPAGPALVSAGGTGWSCSVVVRQVTCQRTNPLNTLASGASFPAVQIVMQVDSDVASGTSYANSATVTNRTYDPVTGNNSSSDDVTVTTRADLAITKALSGSLVAGEDATYTLDVVNNGPSVSRADIVVSDTVPAGTSFVSASGLGWLCPESGGVIICTRNADLAAGAPADRITVVVAVDTARTAAVVNTATVTGPTTDSVPGNNSSTVTTTPGTSADLSLAKVSVGSVVAGETATYRFTVDNAGPSDAAAVSISDDLPTGLTYQGFTSIDGTWSCSAASGTVTCNLSGTLTEGGTAVVEVDVDVASNVRGSIVNTGEVTSTTPDPDSSNNSSTDNSEFSTDADLEITKSHTGSAVAGENVEFTLAVRNNGPSDALGDIVVTDVLPDGLSYVNATGSGWSCDEAAGTVTCTRSTTVDAGSPAPDITLTVKVDPSAGPATITNVASVDSTTTPDTIPANDSDDDDLVVTDETELTVSKTTTGDNPVVAGERTAFSIIVTNDGPSSADNVTVIDTLPTGFADLVITENGWDCDPPVGLVITCRLAELRPGDSPTLVISALVTSDVIDGTTLTNAVEVSTSTPGDSPAGNSDTAAVDVVAEADLILVKTASTGSVDAGQGVTYTLKASNDGFSDAVADVKITDELPVGVTYMSNGGPWTCVAGSVTATGQTVVCTLDAGLGISAGGNAPDLTMLVQLGADADPGTYTNVATLTSGTTDPDPDNNVDSAVVTVGRLVDLVVTKSHTGSTLIGDEVTFTVRVTNNGPSEARSVVSVDTLPTGLSFVSADGTADGWTCNEVAGVVSCALADPLAPDDYAEYTVTAEVLAGAFPTATNSVTAGSDLGDEVPADNTATDVVEVPALVDLSVTKTHTGTLTVGSTGTYTITVSNAGPTDDPGEITLVDTLPTGLSYVSASGTGWSCDSAGQVVTCTKADGLDSGADSSVSLVVDVLPAAAPGVTNAVTVVTTSTETDDTNNDAADPTVVNPVSVLTIRKDVVSFAGITATYRITVGNDGPNATTAPIIVRDTLPAQLTYVSSSGAGWSCASVAPVVTCTRDASLAVGATSSLVVVTSVDARPGTTIVNVATVTGGTGGASAGSIPSDDATLTMPAQILPATAQTGADVLRSLGLAAVLVALGAVLRVKARDRRAV